MSGFDTYGPQPPDQLTEIPEEEFGPGPLKDPLGRGEGDYYQDIEPMSELPAYQPVDTSGPGDLWAARSSQELWRMTQKAFAGGDEPLLQQLYSLQRENASISDNKVIAAGGDPARQVTADAAWTSFEVEAERLSAYLRTKGQMQARAIRDNGLQELKDYFYKDVIPRYKKKNGTLLMKKRLGMSEQELMEYHQQLEPIVEDYTVLQGWRQRLEQMDAALKATDPDNPGLSVYTHPITKNIAGWIGREVSHQQAGYMSMGSRFKPPEPDNWYHGLQKETVEFATDVAVNPVLDLLGMFTFGIGPTLSWMTGDTIGWEAPTNYIETEEGKIITNAGKVPGGTEMWAALWALATGEDVKASIARANAEKQWRDQNESGFESVAKGVGTGLVMIGAGGGAIMGAAKLGFKAGAKMGTSEIVKKGLAKLGSSNSPRALELTRNLSGTLGAMSSTAMLDATMFGEAEGYWRSILHGAMLLPVMAGIAKGGRVLEGALYRATPKQPHWFHRGLSGSVEGASFLAIDEMQSGAIWDLISNPNKGTMQAYLEAMASFGIYKAAFGSSIRPGARETQRARSQEGMDRRLGEGIAMGDLSPEAAGPRGLPPEILRDLGVGEQARKTARSPSQEKAAQEKIKEAKHKIAREDQGVGEQAARIQREFDLEFGKINVKVEGEEAGGVESERIRQKIQDAQRNAPPTTQFGAGGAPPPTGGDPAYKEFRQDIARDPEVKELIEVTRRVHEAEKSSTPEELAKKGYGEKDWEVFSRERGYTEAEIADFRRWMELSRKHGDVASDISFWMQHRQGKPPTTQFGAGGAPPPPGGTPPPPQQPMEGGPPPRPIRTKPGTGMRQPAASPYRFEEAKPGAKPTRRSDVISVAEGRAATRGVRIAFTTIRVGKDKGTAVVVPISSRHLSGAWKGGRYDMYADEARTKEPLAIPETAHEWAHAAQVQVMLGGLEPSGAADTAEEWMNELPSAALMEIPNLLEGYKDWEKLSRGAQGMEAWAEWMGRELMGDETLDLEAPAFGRWMRDWIQAPEQAFFAESSYGPFKKVLQDYMEQGFKSLADEDFLPPLGKGRLRVDLRPLKVKLTDFGKEWFDKINHAWFDDLAHLKSEENTSFQQAHLEPTLFEHPSRLIDITKGMAQKQLENFFLKGSYTLHMTPVPGVMPVIGILDRVAPNQTEFGLYMAQTRAVELIKQGKKLAHPAKVYQAGATDKLRRHPEFGEAGREMKKVSNAVIDVGTEAGLWSQEIAQKIKDNTSLYIPIMVALKESSAPFDAPGMEGMRRGQATKRFFGHTDENMDPLEALQLSFREVLTKAYDNLPKKALFRLALKSRMGSLVTIVDRTVVPEKSRIDIKFREIVKGAKEAIEARGRNEPIDSILEDQFGMVGSLIGQAKLSDAEILTFTQQMYPLSKGGKLIPIVPYFTEFEYSQMGREELRRAQGYEGTMQWMEVRNQAAYNTIATLGRQTMVAQLPFWANWIVTAPKRWIQFNAVSGNPRWALENFVRDVPANLIYNASQVSTPKEALEQSIEMGKRLPAYAKAVAELLLSGNESEMKRFFEDSGLMMSSRFFETASKTSLIGEEANILQKLNSAKKEAFRWYTQKLSIGDEAIRFVEMDEAYATAIAEGNSHEEALFIGYEAGQEGNVNFARGGMWVKELDAASPFIKSNFNGVRYFLKTLAGGKGKTDSEKAAFQRGAFARGAIGITIPMAISWLMNWDEEWWEDLTEEEKLKNIFLTKDIKAPLPYEFGIAFGGSLVALLDSIGDRNPVGLWPLVREALFPYLEGLTGFFPTFAKGSFEIKTGTNWHFGSKIGSRHRTDSIKWVYDNFRPLAKAVGASNARELEYLLDSFTAGNVTWGAQLVEQTLGIRDHDIGFIPNKMKGRPHQPSRFVNDVYARRDKLRDRGDGRTGDQDFWYSTLNAAIKEFDHFRDMADEGRITREDAAKSSYRVAKEALNSVGK